MGARSPQYREEKVGLAVHCAGASLPAEIHQPLSSTAGIVSDHSWCTLGEAWINLKTLLYFSVHYEQYDSFRPICEHRYKH